MKTHHSCFCECFVIAVAMFLCNVKHRNDSRLVALWWFSAMERRQFVPAWWRWDCLWKSNELLALFAFDSSCKWCRVCLVTASYYFVIHWSQHIQSLPNCRRECKKWQRRTRGRQTPTASSVELFWSSMMLLTTCSMSSRNGCVSSRLRSACRNVPALNWRV